MTLKPSVVDNRLEMFKDKYEVVTISVTSSNSQGNFSELKSNVVRDILIQNTGSKTCYLNLGIAAVVSTTSHTSLSSGDSIVFDNVGFTHIAAICGGSDTTTLIITGIARDL